jgi:hypothetical protein
VRDSSSALDQDLLDPALGLDLDIGVRRTVTPCPRPDCNSGLTEHEVIKVCDKLDPALQRRDVTLAVQFQ